ncbi:MAG TPA: LamG domain-containing protein, partial [Planctomycetota bacterium]|nr:LamG domain-containing protein [Planctomycetota bacterium]
TSLKDARPGIAVEGVTVAHGQGRYGDALRFEKKPKGVLFFKAAKNVSWSEGEFSGTVSFWLSLDPERDLEPGYCDPIQITDKKWDDACFWVDFSKDEVPRLFRLGVFPNLREWNPQGRKVDTIPAEERPMVTVKRHPFERGKWTHVAFTFRGLNSGRDDAVAKLYLNGELQGELTGKRTFTWDMSKAAVVIGVNYIGLFDDLAIFNRALGPEEIREVARLEGGVGSLVPQRRPLNK